MLKRIRPTTKSTPTRIFLSYRRDGTAGHAGRLADSLASALREPVEVFLDVGSLRAGENFEAAIEATVADATFVLVLIGQRWNAPGRDGGARMTDDSDM